MNTIEECTKLLTAIFEPEDVIEFRPLPKAAKRWGTIADLPAIVPWLESLNRDGKHAYFGANPRAADGGSKAADVALARCLFADFDGGVQHEEALTRIEQAGLPRPTAIVFSGGGTHAWWRLSEPVKDLMAWTARQKLLIKTLGSDKSIHDAPRIMRLPGFVNGKYEGKPVAIVVEVEATRIYRWSEMVPHAAAAGRTLSASSRAFIDHGTLLDAGRRGTIFAVACDLHGCEWSLAEARDAIMPQAQALGLAGEDLADIPRQIANAFRVPRTPSDAHPKPDVSHLVNIAGLLAQTTRGGGGHRDPGGFPERLLAVPGFIAAVMEHNLSFAFRKQPVLALAAAICLQGTLAARKVRDKRGTRSNIYAVGLAPSGAGKDHARQVNKSILYAAGLDRYVGPEAIASGAGLNSALDACPVVLFQLDEFGRFLKSVGQEKTSSHLEEVITNLLQIWSAAGHSFLTKAYADSTKNRVVLQPCPVVYGTTVEDSFLRALTVDSMSDGFMARVLVFEGAVSPPAEDDVESLDPPADLVAIAKWWGAREDVDREGDKGNLGWLLKPSPRLIETVDGGEEIFRAFRRRVSAEQAKQRGGVSAIWSRAEEKGRHLALIYACSEDHEQPVIDAPAARWACDLVEYLTRRMLWLSEHWISQGVFDSRQKAVLRGIQANGGRATGEQIQRMTRHMTIRERSEMLSNMVTTDLLKSEVVGTQGRPRTVYTAGS